jgi:hypothetical protein
VTVATTGATVTLIRAPGGPAEATILLAVVPPAVAGALDPVYTASDPDVITAAFDVRFINVGAGDLAIITFQYANDNFDLPKLSYFDRATQRQVEVRANLIVVDRFARTVTFVLDRTTVPRLQDLDGTVFTVSVPISIALPVAPPFDFTPLTGLLGLRAFGGPAGASAAPAGEALSQGTTALLAQVASDERGGSFISSEGGRRMLALSQVAPADERGDGERGDGRLPSGRGGWGPGLAPAGFVPDGLPPPPAEFIGLQAATATLSFLDALFPEPPAGGGAAAPDDEGAEAEPGEGADEARDEVFGLIEQGGPCAAEALLLLAACLPPRARRREEVL